MRTSRAHFAEYEGPRLAAWRDDPTRESGRHWHGRAADAPDASGRFADDPRSRRPHRRTPPAIARRTPIPTSWCSPRPSGCGSSATSSRSPDRRCTGRGAFRCSGRRCSPRSPPRWRPATSSSPVTAASSTARSSPTRPVNCSSSPTVFAPPTTRDSPPAEALARHHDWPMPLDFIVSAVERAYTQLDQTSPSM